MPRGRMVCYTDSQVKTICISFLIVLTKYPKVQLKGRSYLFGFMVSEDSSHFSWPMVVCLAEYHDGRSMFSFYGGLGNRENKTDKGLGHPPPQ